MANFETFGRLLADMSVRCVNNMDKADMAAFVVAQRHALQERIINDRQSSAATSSTGNASGAAPGSIMAKLFAQLNSEG